VALIVRSPPVLSGLELRPDLTHSLLGGLTSSGIVRHPAIPIPVRSKALCLGERETALTAMTDEHIETASDLELCILVLKETASVLDDTFREVAKAYILKSDELECLDRMLTMAAARRTSIFRDLNQHRAMQSLRQPAVIDSEEVPLLPKA
jgi:hypothetical protein